MRHLIDRALRIAHDQRTVTCIIVPNDVQERTPWTSRRASTARCHPGSATAAPHRSRAPDDLQRAAEVLNAGEKVAMLVGAGALRRHRRGAARSPRRSAPGVAKALLGKAAVPDDLPYVTGSIGLLGTSPSWEMMNDCDTLLMVGSSFPYSRVPAERGAGARRPDRHRRRACSASATPWR